MDPETISAENLLRDIYQAEAALRWFEQKYALLSEAFYELYQRGQLRDENPKQIQECQVWASWWEIYRDRRERYHQVIDDRLTTISKPVSLDDLHIRKLKIPTSVA